MYIKDQLLLHQNISLGSHVVMFHFCHHNHHHHHHHHHYHHRHHNDCFRVRSLRPVPLKLKIVLVLHRRFDRSKSRRSFDR